MKVKICGITDVDDALFCEKCGVDALGFIFYNKSKRYIEPQEVKKIINRLNPFTLKVGVFVNEDYNTINKVAKQSGINIVQIHGDENFDIVEKIHLPVIKAFRINPDFDFSQIDKWHGVRILLDSFSKELYGGTGQTIETGSIPEEIYSKSILAGGISINNITNILNKEILPVALDISSSIEIAPGIKDHNKVKEIINLIKSKVEIC